MKRYCILSEKKKTNKEIIVITEPQKTDSIIIKDLRRIYSDFITKNPAIISNNIPSNRVSAPSIA